MDHSEDFLQHFHSHQSSFSFRPFLVLLVTILLAISLYSYNTGTYLPMVVSDRKFLKGKGGVQDASVDERIVGAYGVSPEEVGDIAVDPLVDDADIDGDDDDHDDYTSAGEVATEADRAGADNTIIQDDDENREDENSLTPEEKSGDVSSDVEAEWEEHEDGITSTNSTINTITKKGNTTSSSPFTLIVNETISAKVEDKADEDL